MTAIKTEQKQYLTTKSTGQRIAVFLISMLVTAASDLYRYVSKK